MGHASVTTTQVYAKIADRMTENPAKHLDAALRAQFPASAIIGKGIAIRDQRTAMEWSISRFVLLQPIDMQLLQALRRGQRPVQRPPRHGDMDCAKRVHRRSNAPQQPVVALPRGNLSRLAAQPATLGTPIERRARQAGRHIRAALGPFRDKAPAASRRGLFFVILITIAIQI